nr:tetratricopeptide repeat protein [uncultured Lichenicoccus sp.]
MQAPASTSWQALFANGMARHRSGDAPEARRLFRLAAELGGDASPMRLLAILAAEDGDGEEAQAWAHRALAADPGNAASHLTLGRVLSRRADWPGAADAFRRAIGLEPALAAAHLGLAHALLASGNAAAACTSFEQAFALRPPVAADMRGYAGALLAVGDLGKAAAAALRHPASGELRQAHGQLHFRRGDWQPAASALAEAARLLPRDAAILHDLGAALQENAQPSEAREIYLRALAFDPQRAQTWHNLGSACQAISDLPAALAAYGRALQLDPDSLPRIAQELAAGRCGAVWLSADDLRSTLVASAT